MTSILYHTLYSLTSYDMKYLKTRSRRGKLALRVRILYAYLALPEGLPTWSSRKDHRNLPALSQLGFVDFDRKTRMELPSSTTAKRVKGTPFCFSHEAGVYGRFEQHLVDILAKPYAQNKVKTKWSPFGALDESDANRVSHKLGKKRRRR